MVEKTSKGMLESKKVTSEADAAGGGGHDGTGEVDADTPSFSKKIENNNDTNSSAEKKKKKDKQLTKRQRRKVVNDTHKLVQHPKIKSMESRHKAYIRDAGLLPSSRAKDTETLDPKLDLMSKEVKFGRMLGGTNERQRHAAVAKLKAYLKARCDIKNQNGGISELDLLKLWKGLWYTLYMADKVPVQDELSKQLSELIWCVAGTEEEDEYAGQAYMNICEQYEEMMGNTIEKGHSLDEIDDDGYDNDDDDEVQLEEIVNTLEDDDDDDEDEEEEQIEEMKDEPNWDEQEEEEADDDDDDDEEDDTNDAEIPHCRGAHLASLLVRTFFRTIRREWGNMDKYRVDKFYTLIRLYMHEIYTYMATRHWNLGIIRLFNDCIFEEVLGQLPNGLRYHLIDVSLEELAKVNAKAKMPLTEATFLDTLEPFFALAQNGAGDNLVQNRSVERVLQKFLDQYSVVSDNAIKLQQQEENEQSDKTIKKVTKDQNDEEGGGPPPIFTEVHVGTIADFIFQLASDMETKDAYRKSLYDTHKAYIRRVKKVGKDVEIQVDEGNNDDDDDDGGKEGATTAADDMEIDENMKINDEERESPVDDKNDTTVQEKEKEEKKEKLTPTKSKRKKRKKGGDNQGGSNKPDTEQRKSENENAASKKSKVRMDDSHKDEDTPENGGKNKKRKLQSDSSPGGALDELETLSEQQQKHKKKKKERQKKEQVNDTKQNESPKKSQEPKKDMELTQQKKKKTPGRIENEEQEDEVVTISLSEQKHAKAEEQKKKKKQKLSSERTKHQDGERSQSDMDSKKRVKFNSVNRSKSWKASMKALTKLKPPKTANRSPEKGILLNKGQKIVVTPTSKKGKRKGAVSYF